LTLPEYDKNNEDFSAFINRITEGRDAEYIFNMAVCYQKGIRVSKSEKTAIELYKLAANKGYPAALRTVGLMYENGEHVEQSWREAGRLYILAAEKGDAEAQYRIGYM